MKQTYEHHYKKCPTSGCPSMLRIKITSAQYGKIIKITCPQCGMKCKEIIPKPEESTFDEMRESVDGFLSDLPQGLKDFLWGPGSNSKKH